MPIPFHAGIAGRKLETAPSFGSHVFRVINLLDWAASKQLDIPVSAIKAQDYVQVESLLCAIEAQALEEISAKDAMTLETYTPPSPDAPLADLPELAKWRHGAAAQLRWRELLGTAIANHELQLLDYGSKLPIVIALDTQVRFTPERHVPRELKPVSWKTPAEKQPVKGLAVRRELAPVSWETPDISGMAKPAPALDHSAHAPQAAEPVAQTAPAMGEPKRRLDALRANGGDVKWRRNQWKVTGINALVRQEEGRPRSSHKTIHGDLVEAAETEKREGAIGPSWRQ